MSPLLKTTVERVLDLELGSWGTEEDLLFAGTAGGMIGLYLGFRSAGVLGAIGGLVAGSILAGTAALPVSLAYRRSKTSTSTPHGAPQ